MEKYRNYLKNVAIHAQGDYSNICYIIKNKISVPHYSYEGNFICICDFEYPQRLRDLSNPPIVVFYEGNIDLLNLPCIGVVGNRKPSSYALKCTEELVTVLKQRYVIVSGLAYGIDICAHRAALDFKTICVLGCGIDVCYPQEHHRELDMMCKSHCAISEYPLGIKPKPHHFPFRNRIIAALSETLYVMSARMKSGTMHTVEASLTLNRPIVVLPHQIDDMSGAGCNHLIQEGAEVLTNIKDLSNI